MSKPRLFIGSSEKNLKVAELLRDALEKEECADVVIWNNSVFELNQGFLETLEEAPEHFDFAIFILAPDDTTTSKGETKSSPRDNVLFESGLFMGVLGRERVFLVYDETAGLKIPSDFAGVMLASYDGAHIQDADASVAVQKARQLIKKSIDDSRVKHLDGEWMSIYRKTDEKGQPLIEETVEIRTCGDCIYIDSKSGKRPDDYYKAKGWLPEKRQIIGEWKSHEDSCDTSGTFLLVVNPASTFICGYFTSPDEWGGINYAGWILAKQTGVDQAILRARLKEALKDLKKMMVNISPQSLILPLNQ